MNNEKKDDAIIFNEFFEEKIKACRLLEKIYSEKKLDKQYCAFCSNVASDLIKLYRNLQYNKFKPEFEAYNFFCVYVAGFFNYILDTPKLRKDKINRAQKIYWLHQ